MIYDAHMHISTSKKEFMGEKLFSSLRYCAIVNVDSERDFFAYKKLKNAFLSFGIHPWNAEIAREDGVSKTLLRLKEYYENADVIGEIGLDNFWSQVDEDIQIQVFKAQLDLAAEQGKPVVLHLKGMEKKALEILKGYELKKLIHWYSCEDYIYDFIELGCYFTIGVDILASSKTSEKLAELVPLERLLVETDGLEAAEWALDKSLEEKDIPILLCENMRKVAEIRGISEKVLAAKIEENFLRFLEIPK